MALRINRFLSQSGLGSRRAVEDLVREGRVCVNGERVTDLGRRVDPEHDRVEVDGRPVEPQVSGRVILLHKPVGVVSSLRRQDARPCLGDLLTEAMARGRLFHVGRLDHDSSGLILLTDDGDLADALLHPRHPVWKRYSVDTRPPLDGAGLQRFEEGGIELDGRPCLPAGIELEDDRPDTGIARYTIELREGRKRQIRRMVEALGSRVVRLHRIAFGPVGLGDLAAGRWREASAQELAALREAAARAGD